MAIMSILSALRRVDFNRIMKALEGEKTPSQKLLLPITMEFGISDDEFFRANRALFESCGFEIDDFGKGYYRIAATPAWLEFQRRKNLCATLSRARQKAGSERAPRGSATKCLRISRGQNRHRGLRMHGGIRHFPAIKSPLVPYAHDFPRRAQNSVRNIALAPYCRSLEKTRNFFRALISHLFCADSRAKFNFFYLIRADFLRTCRIKLMKFYDL